MEWGIGVDASLQLSFAESRALVNEAVAAGYTSAWTPSGPPTRDGFQMAAQWATATEAAIGTPIQTGVAVIAAPTWSPTGLAQTAGTISALSGGRFILGLGTGNSYTAEYRAMVGAGPLPTVAMMKDYLIVLRGLFAGESVTHEGKVINVHGMRVSGQPLNVPLYVAALGPQMLRLSGELADGICLNWTTPQQRIWCREQVAKGAERSDRDPSQVQFMEFIRVCVDEDEARARREFTKALMGYALARPGASKDFAYRAHFTRMGFDPILSDIESRRDAGASTDEIVEMFPDELLNQMGYFGNAAGAPAAMKRLSEGLDNPVVRIVGSRPGMDAARAVMDACRPA